MNKTELAEKLAKHTGSTKADAARTVDAVIDIITDTIVANEEVAIPALGKLVAVFKPAREGRNPATGATVQIPASRKATFKASKALKDRLNGTV